jgi:YD repeat-containing protein
MDRLVTRTPDASFGEAAVGFTYTPTGLRATMTDGSGTTSYGYDNQNRVLTKTTVAGRLTYTYDGAGNRLSAMSSNMGGTNVAYTYDELNRIKTVVDNGGPAQTSYSYDAVGNVTSTMLPNGAMVAPQYDAMNRMTYLAFPSNQTSGPLAGLAQKTFNSIRVSWDLIGLSSETRSSLVARPSSFLSSLPSSNLLMASNVISAIKIWRN